MPIFLYALFLKAPVWVRVFVLLGFAGILLFGCLYAVSTVRLATERPVPAHVQHPRKY